jgi:hypothetical protein
MSAGPRQPPDPLASGIPLGRGNPATIGWLERECQLPNPAASRGRKDPTENDLGAIEAARGERSPSLR